MIVVSVLGDAADFGIIWFVEGGSTPVKVVKSLNAFVDIVVLGVSSIYCPFATGAALVITGVVEYSSGVSTKIPDEIYEFIFNRCGFWKNHILISIEKINGLKSQIIILENRLTELEEFEGGIDPNPDPTTAPLYNNYRELEVFINDLKERLESDEKRLGYDTEHFRETCPKEAEEIFGNLP